MNRLECQVNSCQHFQNHQCCLMGIQVDGPAAQECSQTCCASYEERRAGAGQNAMGQNPTVETDIHCNVKSCCLQQPQPLRRAVRLRGLLLRGCHLQERHPVQHLPEQVKRRGKAVWRGQAAFSFTRGKLPGRPTVV